MKMGGPITAEGQTYCLKWNNHKSNLVEILDALIKMESYVDCTIVVDDQVQFKAHRVVLAANSPYFQSILQDVPMDHCSILFPGVQAFEMRALLEYMYTGEVNVTQSQIPKIMRIAEQLEVKGLFDMTDLKEKFNKFEENSVGNPYAMPQPLAMPPYPLSSKQTNEVQNSSPLITTSTNISSAAPSSSSSPPYSYKSPYGNIYSKSPNSAGPSAIDRHSAWPISPVMAGSMQPSAAAAMLSSVYETATDMNPLKRKKLSSISSMIMNRDTPILRNVLAQTHSADSSQPMPLVCQPSVKQEKNEKSINNSGNISDYGSDKKYKYDEPHSPYTDRSFEDDGLDCPPNFGSDSRLSSFGSQQNNQKPEWKRYKQYTRNDILSAIECVRNGMSALQASRKFGVPSRTLYDKVKKMGITTGRPMNRTIKRSPSSGNGSAGFPFGLSGTGNPYSQEQMLSSMHEVNEREKDRERERERERDRDREHHMSRPIPSAAAALLDPAFLQQAFESRGGDIAGRDALHAMALAAAAHAAVNGMSTSPGTNGTARSPSPSLAVKYGRTQSPYLSRERDILMERERELERERDRDRERERERQMIDIEIEREREREREHERETEQEREYLERQHEKHRQQSDDEDEEQVEDLSVGRKDTPTPPMASTITHHSYRSLPSQNGSVIVPPMTKISNSKDDFVAITENTKREIICDDGRD